MHLLKPAILTVLATLGGGSNPTTLHFDPAPQTTLATTWEAQRDLDGGALSVLMDGAEVPEAYLPDLHLVESDHRVVSVVETVQETSDGFAMVRRYDDLTWTNEGSMSMDGMQGAQEFPWDASADTPLADATVLVVGDGDEPFSLEPVDETTPELPEGLAPDLSARAFLPGEPMALEESWTVEGGQLVGLFDPSGDCAWELPEEAAAEMLPEIDTRKVEGSLTMVLETIEEDRATMRVSGELVRITTKEGDLSMVPVAEGTATDTIRETWEVNGTLVWNVAQNHLHELLLDGPLLSATRTEKDPGQPGGAYESLFEVEGNYTVEARAEVDTTRTVDASSPQ